MAEMDVDVDLDVIREYATEAPRMLPSIARQTLLASYCLSVVALAEQLHAALLKERRDRDKEARIAQDWFERHSAAEAERDRARATAVAMESMLAETKAALNAANAELMALNQQLCGQLAECQRQLGQANRIRAAAEALLRDLRQWHDARDLASDVISDEVWLETELAALAPTGQPEPPTPDEGSANVKAITSTQYFNPVGTKLWAEPMVMARLWRVGQTFVANYIKYRVLDVTVVNDWQLVVVTALAPRKDVGDV